MTAALIQAGFQYLTDDVCLVDEVTLRVRGLPFSLCIKDTGLDVIARMYPEARGLTFHTRRDGKRVCFLAPPASAALCAEATDLSIERVVFPRYEPAAPVSLRPLGRAEGFRRLMENGAKNQPLTHERVARLVDWFRGIACFEIRLSSLDQAVAKLEELCRQREAR